jgi:hypothetical protein
VKRRRLKPGELRNMQELGRQQRLEKAVRAGRLLPRREERSIPGANGYTQRVFAIYGVRCMVCGAKAVHAHHVVPKRTIVARGEADFPLVYDARNGFPICPACHERHEKAFRRIWRHELAFAHVDWAESNGFGWVIERYYPVRTAIA